MIAQIKSGAVTYSVYALARLFLDKPERYDVRLTAAEGSMLHQLGENGPVATDRRILENNAFAAMKDEFYTVEQTQSEPLKGNFTNVARDRISGTLLGPTNHHSYQPQLRSLYEQRYSRRMSFQDFQRQIEVVNDPAVVEQWKEQARNVTTYIAKNTEPSLTFNTAAETERHFRQTHLPSLLREAQDLTVSGVASRRLEDRALGRVIENAWAAETRSPSKMMQELANGLRQANLNIFRHRRGMLFVSPIRLRNFGHERTGVSATINAILETLSATPGINRKQLLEKSVAPGAEVAEIDRAKMSLASDLRWLISEGYMIEFNDGTLDLPRTKPPAGTQTAPQGDQFTTAPEARADEYPPNAANEPPMPPSSRSGQPAVPATPFDSEVVSLDQDMVAGEDTGMSVEQSIEPIASELPTAAPREIAELAAESIAPSESTADASDPAKREQRPQVD